MTNPDEDQGGTPILDPDRLGKDEPDVGGPQASLGSEADSALIGDDPESGDEGRTGSNPKPTGV